MNEVLLLGLLGGCVKTIEACRAGTRAEERNILRES